MINEQIKFRDWVLTKIRKYGAKAGKLWYWDRTCHYDRRAEYAKKWDIPKEVMPFPARIMYCMMIAELERVEEWERDGIAPYPNAELVDHGPDCKVPCWDDYHEGECWIWNRYIWLFEYFNDDHPRGDGYYRATPKEVEQWLVESWTLEHRSIYFREGEKEKETPDAWLYANQYDFWDKSNGPFRPQWKQFYGLTANQYPKMVKRTAKLVARLWASLARESNPRIEEEYGIVKETKIDSSLSLQEQVLDALELRDISDRATTVFRRYCKGENQDTIADSLSMTQSTVAVDIRSVREQIGYAFEDVYSARLTHEKVPHERGGENTPEPDIIILDADGRPKEIHSLKCYIVARNRSGATVPREKVGRSERALSLTGIPLYLIFYDIVADRLYPKVLVEEQLTFTFKRSEVIG